MHGGCRLLLILWGVTVWGVTVMAKCYQALGVLSMLIVLAGCVGKAETPDAEAKRMIRAAANMQIAEVVSLFPPDARQEYQSASPARKQALANTVRLMSQHAEQRGGIKELVVVEQRITGDTASVTIETIYNNGERGTDTFQLRRYGDDWCSATAIPF